LRLERFDMNLLVVLDTLLEERNVTRASQRLHIGQSATSAALARLRDYFEDQLLVQVGRRMEPTPLGESLIGPVRDILMRARAAIAIRPTFEPAEIKRAFSVGASDYAIEVLLGLAVRDLARTAPGMRIDIRNLPNEVPEVFERGEIDLLIIPEQYASQIKHPQIELLRDDHVCMMCEDAKVESAELTMERYLELGHVSVRLGEEASLAFEEWFLPRYGRQRRVECTVDQFNVTPLLVVGTERVVTTHRRLAEQMLRRFPIKLMPVPFDMPPLVEMMVWPRYLDEDPAHKWLRAAVLSVAQELINREKTGRLNPTPEAHSIPGADF